MKQMRTAKGERHEAPKVLHHIEVKEAENGGHVVSHHFENKGMGYHDPEEHVFGADEGKQAMEHIASAANIKGEPADEEEQDESEEA
jgi:hypothetical protein